MGGGLKGVGGGFEKVFGKMDGDATNSVDDAGNVVATGTQGAKEVMDPNHGLNFGNMMARGLARGAGNGLQQQFGSQYKSRSGGFGDGFQAPSAAQPQLGPGAYGQGQQYYSGIALSPQTIQRSTAINPDMADKIQWPGQQSAYRFNKNAFFGS